MIRERDSGAVYVFERAGTVWSQQAYLKASNPDVGDMFGNALSLSADTLAVGVQNESSNGLGVNPTSQGDNSASFSGAVYVFVRAAGVWAQQAYVKASNSDPFDRFGFSVALHGDAMAVGAAFESSGASGVDPAGGQTDNSSRWSGAVYVFERTAGVWAQESYIKASNPGSGDLFGVDVVLLADTLVVGASAEDSPGQGVNPDTQASDGLVDSGAAYVFRRNGVSWMQEAYLKAQEPSSNGSFGRKLALEGDVLVVSEFNATVVHALRRDSSSGWSYVGRATEPNGHTTSIFSSSVSLSGNEVAIGANGEPGGGTGVNPSPFLSVANDSGAAFVYAILAPRPPDVVAVYSANTWLADTNANGFYDPAFDRSITFGFPGATPIAGDWNGDGKVEAGLFANGFWFLDYDGNDLWDGGVNDRQYEFGWNGVTPLVGDWNGDGRDTVGIFVNGFWYLDADGNGLWDGPGVDIQAHFGWSAVTPKTGDWNGDGRDKIGIYVEGFWYLDYDGSAAWDGPGIDRQAHLGWEGATPVVGDWDGDRRATIGVYLDGDWYLDRNGDGSCCAPGVDMVATFGFQGATPVWGDWSGDGRDKIGAFYNGLWLLDYDGSGAFESANDSGIVFGQPGDLPVPDHGKAGVGSAPYSKPPVWPAPNALLLPICLGR